MKNIEPIKSIPSSTDYSSNLPKVIKDLITKYLGHSGRLISSSKSSYHEKFPTHLVLFNANVIYGEVKIWYGDLDLTLELEELQNFSRELSDFPIFILYEMDGRFQYEKNPQIQNHVIKIYNEEVEIGPKYKDYLVIKRKKIYRASKINDNSKNSGKKNIDLIEIATIT